MKSKNPWLRTLPLLAAAAFLQFISSTTALAQDLSGLSFCIDPGHGAGTPNQGPTGLREADINLQVALFLNDFLRDAGADTILLTRVDDTTNPSLSQREALANNFGVDWFHSVHHNAFNGNSRFTLLLYEERRDPGNRCPDGSVRGTGEADWPGEADVMSPIMASRIFQGLRTTDFLHRLDWTFYGGCNGGFSLGVLNDLLMPGELSEATFHDNLTEENKLRNLDFLRLEARAIFMSFLDFYEAGEMTTGVLSGIVTSESSHTPLNGVPVTLEPGGISYATDDHDNGLFVFHDLQPGTYRVTAAASGFDTTDATIEVSAHAFSAVDLRLPDASPPIVELSLPAPGANNVDVYESLGLRFDKPMDRESVESAFSLTPDAAGHFVWSGDEVVLYELDTRLEFEKEYTLTLTGSARGQSGRFLDGDEDGESGGDFLLNFVTRMIDDSVPVVLDFFPTRGDTGIFMRDVFEITFNQPLAPATINDSNIQLILGANNQIPALLDYPDASAGRVTLIAQEPLSAGSSYFIQINPGLSLPDGSEFSKIFAWRFTTQTSATAVFGIDSFEDTPFQWTNPADSPFSGGFSPDSTTFAATSVNALSGLTAGGLKYEFTETGGLIQIDFLADNMLFRQDEVDAIGCYVYGDASGNRFRLLIQDSDGIEMLPAMSVSQSGWQLYRQGLDIAGIEPGPDGNGQLDAVEFGIAGLRLTRNGASKGQLFFDDLFRIAAGTPVSVEPDPAAAKPRSFSLLQNYPNPFNPETTVPYRVSGKMADKRILLQIFDLKGRLVRDLVNGFVTPGLHLIRWNGRKNDGELAASAVYLYRLRAGLYEETRKLILLK